MRNLMPIGRFSQMTRLSVKALRHYDQLGLLCPAYVDPDSNYRYYEPEQARTAEIIRTLRGLDMPLDRIGEVLGDGDRASLLSEHRRALSRRLSEYERMLRYLEQLMMGEDMMKTYEITIEEVPEQTVASLRLRADLEGMKTAVPFGFGSVMGHLQAHGAAPAGIPLIVYHDWPDDGSEAEVEVCIPVAGEIPDGDDITVVELVGGPMAATTHVGPYDQLGPAYHALHEWMQEHGHETAGPPREIYLNSPEDVEAEQLQTRIHWPVR